MNNNSACRFLETFLLIFLSWTLVTAYGPSSKSDDKAGQIMRDKVGRAFYIACRKQFLTHDKRDNCTTTLYWRQASLPTPEKFARRIAKRAPSYLPKYHPQCAKYTDIERINDSPPVDESKVLKDKGLEYGLKAYAHCLVNAVRKIDGDKAVVFHGRKKSRKSGKGKAARPDSSEM